MSNIYVRQTLIAYWPILTPSLPFVATINEPVDFSETEVPIWGSFIFDASVRNHETMGSRPWIEEQGSASVALVGYSGISDDDIAAMADVVTKAWEMWINPERTLWIQSVDPPTAPDTEAVGDMYRLAVSLNYRYQTRGGS
jgi:hypothetical protein